MSQHFGRIALAAAHSNGSINLLGAVGKTLRLRADRVDTREWETFTIIRLAGDGTIQPGDQVALRADNQRYVAAENGGGGPLVANRKQIGPWETFTLVAGPSVQRVQLTIDELSVLHTSDWSRGDRSDETYFSCAGRGPAGVIKPKRIAPSGHDYKSLKPGGQWDNVPLWQGYLGEGQSVYLTCAVASHC